MRYLILLIIMVILHTPCDIFAQAEPQQPEQPTPGIGLSVQPGGLLIQFVKLDQTYDLYEKSGIALIIENKDTNPHTYILTTSKPSQVGNRKWLKGYLEIPDPSWFWLEKDEVTIAPQSKEAVKMYLRIPEEEKYYNQHWTVSLGVSGKPKKGETITLAVYPRYQIETESKTGLKEKPDGLIAFEPSTVIFKDLALGRKEKAKIIIYNNDTKSHKYKIIPHAIEADPTREQIVASPGYTWIPNINWIKPDKKRLEIKPGESKELTVSVNIPDKKEYYQKKWEALIFVEPEEGLSGFIRLQIMTAQEAIP